jgi:hypothetical protein
MFTKVIKELGDEWELGDIVYDHGTLLEVAGEEFVKDKSVVRYYTYTIGAVISRKFKPVTINVDDVFEKVKEFLDPRK